MVHKSKLTQTAGVLFALTLMAGFARPASAAYGPLQPLACGEAKSNLETYHGALRPSTLASAEPSSLLTRKARLERERLVTS